MIAQLPSLAQDTSALVIGTAGIVASVVGTIAYIVGHAHGERDATQRLERWQRRRP